MDAATTPSSSSKVIVQCSDQYDLFDKVLPYLEARSPLGNLHWKSPSRPLRSIDKLDVSFIREVKTADKSHSARRHQIPGLRPTPYVKLFLLRCDDKDTYKETAKKEIRQWLKSQEISSDGKSGKKGQERHDAFEYMIVHIVLPGTAAANQPRSSKHISVDATESTDSVNSKSKWPGKGSSTIYDKLRADFSSSKASFERVAQIRIQDENVKPAAGLGLSEVEEQSLDFVDKLKKAILQSFDARVAQYEDDIRDRDGQRALPGWNFCTFFVLKEGLAKGFENVGLLEDALAVYEELDAGLDSIVREQSDQTDADSAGALLPFSQDLKPAIRNALDSSVLQPGPSDGFHSISDLESVIRLEKQCFPLDADRVDYQQRILTNQVSALDLRMYMYTRKLRILFRKARNAATSQKQKAAGSQLPYEISIVSDICVQASEFISFAARALRRDLYAAWGGQQGLNDDELETQDLIIGNLVASWKVSVILQILDECQVTRILHDKLIDGFEDKEIVTEIDSNTMSQSGDTSATPRSSSIGQISVNIMGESRPNLSNLQRASYLKNSTKHNDDKRSLAGLALWVAELLVMLRAVVYNARPEVLQCCFSESINNHGKSHHQDVNGNHKTSGIKSATFLAVHTSAATCMNVFRLFTVFAFRCYRLANQTQAARRMLLNLAQVDFEAGDLAPARTWLEKIPGLVDIQPRTSTDLELLRVYAKCLGGEGLSNRYVRCLLGILRSFTEGIVPALSKRSNVEIQTILDELLAMSSQIEDTELPFGLLFAIIEAKNKIKHIENRDGFSFSVYTALRFPVKLETNLEFSLQLSSVAQGEPSRLTLHTSLLTALNTSPSEVLFESNDSMSQTYEMVQLCLSIGKLHFRHNFGELIEGEESLRRLGSTTRPKLVVFPRAESLSVDACAAYVIDLTQAKRVRVVVHPGQQDIHDAVVRIRPATAGIRLSLHEAAFDDNGNGLSKVPMEISQQEGVTAIKLSSLKGGNAVALNIPYATENSTIPALELKFEVLYHTAKGDFTAYFSKSVDINLPLTINVQDVFQSDGIFSRFTAGPSRQAPVRILDWHFESISAGEIITSQVAMDDVVAFSRMPATCMVRIRRRNDKEPMAHCRLALQVQYQRMEDIVLSSIAQTFTTEPAGDTVRSRGSLLLSHLLKQVPRLWTDQDLENWALTREVELWPFEEMQWDDALHALHEEERAEADAWLRLWHTKSARIKVSGSRTNKQALRLLVDVPTPGLMLSSQLSLDRNPGQSFYSQGQAISTHLEISCDGDMDEGAQIIYEIKGQADTWLVGGTRKGSFPVVQGRHAQQLLLIPQKTGHLLLPSIEMRCRRGSPNEDLVLIPCEVENRSQAQSILVVSGLHSTTVATGFGGADGASSGHILVATRRRV